MVTKDDLMKEALMKKYSLTKEEVEKLYVKLEEFASTMLERFSQVASDFKRIAEYNAGI